MAFVEIPTGARLHYIDTYPEGNPGKPVVILVHGMLGTAELHFSDLIEWLKEDYRVLGPTLRGYGESTPKPRSFPRDFYRRDMLDVLAFMNELNIDSAHILGFSDGGEIALLAAGSAPERFRSVTVWGAVGYYGPAMRPIAQKMFPGTWITQEERDLHGIEDADAFVLGWIEAVKGIIDSGGDLSLSLADQITAPLLLMLGREDTLNPAEYGQRLVELTPHGRLQLFDCGHAIHTQEPEAFKQAIGDFIREVS